MASLIRKGVIGAGASLRRSLLRTINISYSLDGVRSFQCGFSSLQSFTQCKVMVPGTCPSEMHQQGPPVRLPQFINRAHKKLCTSSSQQGEETKAAVATAAAEKPARRKMSKKQRFGKYGQDFEDEMAQFPVDDSIEHLYDTRTIVEEWMGHPTFYDMISEDAFPKKGAPKTEPPGEGPILRWETRVVLSPGGEAFHPANRKVKVSVYVKELELTSAQKERLLFMVGKRYNANKDELTIVSERFDQREENRKDVLRTLLALIDEAKKEPDVVDGQLA